MRYLTALISVAAFMFCAGCVSHEPPADIRAWARQQVAEKQKLEAEKNTHAQEIARLKAENERARAQAEEDRQWAEAVQNLAANKNETLKGLTQAYDPDKQAILEELGIKGIARELRATDITLVRVTTSVPVRRVALFSLVIIWQNIDGTGGVLRLDSGYDIDTKAFVYSQIAESVPLSREEMASAYAVDEAKLPAPAQSSNWAPTRETVNEGYRTAIKVGGAILSGIIVDYLSGN